MKNYKVSKVNAIEHIVKIDLGDDSIFVSRIIDDFIEMSLNKNAIVIWDQQLINAIKEELNEYIENIEINQQQNRVIGAIVELKDEYEFELTEDKKYLYITEVKTIKKLRPLRETI